MQVKRQIADLISSGDIKVGSRMPTERELAKKLRISRNTISNAYKELESDGILKSYQGRGTFVVEEVIPWKNKEINNKILKFVDMALEEALSVNMDVEELLDIVKKRIEETKHAMMRMEACYVECNIEQSKMFSKQLSKHTNMNVEPLTINDLKEMNENTITKIENAKVIISTFNHVGEVQELTKGMDKEVFGVAIIPDIETIVKIARYPDKTKFAFVCISEKFMYKIKGALEMAGLDNLDIEYTNETDKKQLQDMIEGKDVVIVSPGKYKVIEEINNKKIEIIKFLYSLDDGSLKNLKAKMVDIQT
ncbi:GntR family transcriptional regulator [Oceanirhabdus seepicola]|uniref:GntR family transcriptional regulator n=1 Tax=Oceanirhabdus seepicola TaxID=2828781 RepID=UPI0030B8C5F0